MKQLLLSLFLLICAACHTSEDISGSTSDFPVLTESNVNFELQSKEISIEHEIRFSSFYVYRVDSSTYVSIADYAHAVTPGVRFEISSNDTIRGSFEIRNAPIRIVNYKCKSASDNLIINLSPIEF